MKPHIKDTVSLFLIFVAALFAGGENLGVTCITSLSALALQGDKIAELLRDNPPQ